MPTDGTTARVGEAELFPTTLWLLLLDSITVTQSSGWLYTHSNESLRQQILQLVPKLRQ